MVLTFLQHKHCSTRVMGPKHAHGNNVDLDQTPLEDSGEKKSCQFIKKKVFIVKPLLFSEILFYSHEI